MVQNVSVPVNALCVRLSMKDHTDINSINVRKGQKLYTEKRCVRICGRGIDTLFLIFCSSVFHERASLLSHHSHQAICVCIRGHCLVNLPSSPVRLSSYLGDSFDNDLFIFLYCPHYCTAYLTLYLFSLSIPLIQPCFFSFSSVYLFPSQYSF